MQPSYEAPFRSNLKEKHWSSLFKTFDPAQWRISILQALPIHQELHLHLELNLNFNLNLETFDPAQRRRLPILQAWPTHQVDIGGSTYYKTIFLKMWIIP